MYCFAILQHESWLNLYTPLGKGLICHASLFCSIFLQSAHLIYMVLCVNSYSLIKISLIFNINLSYQLKFIMQKFTKCSKIVTLNFYHKKKKSNVKKKMHKELSIYFEIIEPFGSPRSKMRMQVIRKIPMENKIEFY